MDQYTKGETLGEGTFGKVIKATHKQTGQVVAIKKIRLGLASEGVNMTALREIKLLNELHSPYIVRLLDVFEHKQKLNLVFEFMESDLEMLIRDRATILSPADVKAYLQQLLRALAFCHAKWVLHRDVKPNNFLLGPTGAMKLADFGLARLYGSPESRRFTGQVFASWYRAPELLYGASMYGPAVDMWAAGCVFAELLLRRPWLPGTSDLDQLGKIFAALGTPTAASWPGHERLPTYVAFQDTPPPDLRATFKLGMAGEAGLDLLQQLVSLDPRKRPSAEQALAHRYFSTEPLPSPLERLPKPPVRAQNPTAGPGQMLSLQEELLAAAKGGLGAAAESRGLVYAAAEVTPEVTLGLRLGGGGAGGANPGGAPALDLGPTPDPEHPELAPRPDLTDVVRLSKKRKLDFDS